MKKVLLACVLTIIALSLMSCGKTKILHCDNCGREISAPADSPADDSWILYCSKCEKELGLDKVVK